MVIKNDSTANSEDGDSIDKKKTKKIANKLKAMGMMSSDKKSTVSEATPKTESHIISSALMALIVAIPTATIVAYIVMPQQLNSLLSSDNNSSSAIVADANLNYFQVPSMANGNRVQQPEWVTQQRAEMDKRRVEFEKLNAGNYLSNRASSEPPQWIKDRQAQMDKRRSELEKQNAGNYQANRNASEPPQWVKDQQTLMQQEQARYQQEWAKRSANMPYNGAREMPGYMNYPVNSYQQPNQAPVNMAAQNSGWNYNGQPQPVNPYGYNNNPYYAPNNAPNGYYGYPYW